MVAQAPSVGAVLLAIFLVRRLSREATITLIQNQRTSPQMTESVEGRLWTVSHIRRTCLFVYSFVGYREMSVAGSVGVALFLRSLCDLKMVHLTSAVENAIVSRNPLAFRTALGDFLGFMVPVSCLNSLLNYAINELALCLRERLSVRLLRKYAANDAFYRVGLAFCGTSGRSPDISYSHNPSQVLTHDLEEFTDALAGLFSHTLKPTVDVIIFAERLWSTFGKEAPLTLGLYMLVSGAVLNYMRMAAGHFAAGEQEIEGAYRHSVARLHEHAEQVASFGGGARELLGIHFTLNNLLKYVRSFAQFRGSMSVIDSVAGKYVLTFLGWIVLGHSFIDNSPLSKMHNKTSDEIYFEYHTFSKMMVNLSAAIGAILLSGRDFVRCLGMAERICDFEDLLDLFGKTGKGVVQNAQTNTALRIESLASRDEIGLQLTDVPLTTPNDEVLVPAMSLSIISGKSLLITGPNGSGKSSLMRVLAGLWIPKSGTLYRGAAGEMITAFPERNSSSDQALLENEIWERHLSVFPVPGMMYLPQKPYMPPGTLREQIIYPSSYPQWGNSENDTAKKIKLDQLLAGFLRRVHLEYLLEREGGWDASSDWSVVLSGGEKQRISIARLYYHRPTFALLDESTSAVHEEVEDGIYRGCKDIGITLITVSHRISVRKHHDIQLRFDGKGGFEVTPVT